MKVSFFYLLAILILMVSCTKETPKQPMSEEQVIQNPPKWAENQIWYQIFVERFNNGNDGNDPTPADIIGAWPYEVPDDWQITPWTHDWHKKENWSVNNDRSFSDNTQLRRYGGDLQGVIKKLDYLQDLGITAIYFNPLNFAPSLHKYDAASFHHIDPSFGPDTAGDFEMMAAEDPTNPDTWQWTSADRMFLDLIKQAHNKGIRVVLDYSWNHTGLEFWAWKDILDKGKESNYADWYMINSFDNPETVNVNEFSYEGWLGFSSLPELKKVNFSNREHGKPYPGNIQDEVKQHIFDVTKRWLAPNGETEHGLDGFRLDVADQIPMDFWKEYRAYVKSIKPDAYLVGENWWEDFPDHLMNPRPYLGEPAFDAVMFYQAYRPARRFFGVNERSIDAQAFVKELENEWNDISPAFLRSMMGLNASHDTPRLLTSMDNNNIYKLNASTSSDNDYNSGKPKQETYLRTKLYLLHQYTSLSSPHIWNGDEMGMWGADDPHCRKPLWWPEFQFEDESDNPNLGTNGSTLVEFNREHFEFYKQMIQLRKNRKSLQFGDIEFLGAENKKLAYRRSFENEKTFVFFNAGNETIEFDLPLNVQNIITYVNEQPEIIGRQIKLKPLSGAVFGS